MCTLVVREANTDTPVSSRHRPQSPQVRQSDCLCNRLGSRVARALVYSVSQLPSSSCLCSPRFNCHQFFLWVSHPCVELLVFQRSNFERNEKVWYRCTRDYATNGQPRSFAFMWWL